MSKAHLYIRDLSSLRPSKATNINVGEENKGA